MRRIRDVLRLHFEKNLGQHVIAASVRASQSTISEYLARYQTTGLGWPPPETMTDQGLEDRLFPPSVKNAKPVERAPSGRLLLQPLLRAVRAVGKGQNPVMRQIHRAGEKLFVDWAGDTIPYRDRDYGAVRRASLFVAVLGASSYTYAEASADQKLGSWIGAHIRAFEFLQVARNCSALRRWHPPRTPAQAA